MGIWDVDAWLRRITSDQLTEWMAFDQLEPIGQENYLAAMISSTTANCMRGSDSQPYSADDFLLKGALADAEPDLDDEQALQEKFHDMLRQPIRDT